FQGENAAVAYAAVLSLRSRGWKVDDFAMLSGFRAARWPGRLEIVRRDPTVIVDGAHNPDAAAALMESLAELVPGKVTLVMGVLVDKDIDLMAAQLVPRVSKMIAVRPKTERALPPEKVSAAFTAAALRMGIPAPPATIIPDAKEAVAAALRDAARADVVLVAGSIYVAGEALEALAHGP
ncbi:MAG TPA: cyanophycin synthetase, partial [Thermoplasmata archaeon]|nr:cyanophycin synthetase [Thermoplasmata archaeon]